MSLPFQHPFETRGSRSMHVRLNIQIELIILPEFLDFLPIRLTN